MALDLHEWLVQQRDPDDDDYRVIFSEYENIIPLTSTTGVMINSTDLDLEWLGHTIPADTIIYGDQSTSFSQVLSEIGEIDDIQLRLSSVDDFADLSAAPVDDVEFEWSSGNDDLRGTINDTEMRFYTKSDEGLNITLANPLIFTSPTSGETTIVRNDVKWLAGTSHDDVFTGDENATRFAITGGNDVISAGAGNDEYDFWDPNGHLTITDYENFERIRFSDDGHYNFSDDNYLNEISIEYDQASDSTLIYVETDTFERTEMVKIEGSFELSHMEWLPDKNDMNLYFSDGSDIVGTEQDDHLYGTPNNDLIRGMGGDDYIEALGGDDEIYGGDGDEDIRIQAGDSKIYGGLGWDTLEIDDKTSDYVTITYTDGENGIVQGYNSDGVELYISEFESINRIVQVSEIELSIFRRRE